MRNVLLGLIFVPFFASTSVKALDFDFSITGDPSYTDEGITSNAGTITGEIIGLQDNASSDPSDIIITSAPTGLGFIPTPFSLVNGYPGYFYLDGGTFTVADGVITSADFSAYSNDDRASFDFNVTNSINLALNGFVSLSTLSDFGTEVELSNGGGFQGVTYTAVQTPEPSTYAMMLLGLCAIGLCVRRQLA